MPRSSVVFANVTLLSTTGRGVAYSIPSGIAVAGHLRYEERSAPEETPRFEERGGGTAFVRRVLNGECEVAIVLPLKKCIVSEGMGY